MRANLSLLLLIAVGELTVDAQESPSQTSVEKVAPFVDVLTRGVIHIDLRRADVESLMDLAIPIVPQAFFYETSFRADFEQTQAALQAVGIEEVFVVLSLAELPRQLWFAIAPCPDDLDSKKLASQLPADLPERLGASQSLTVECLDTGDSGRVLFIGIEDTLTRLKHGQVTHRPELAAAFAAIGDAPLRAVCIPTDDDRRVAEELFPTLPDTWGGGPSSVLSRGLQWAALAADLQPEPAIRLVIQSADGGAADALRSQCAKVLTLLGQKEANLPEAVDDRLVLNLNQRDGGLKGLQVFTQFVIDETTRKQLKEIGLVMARWHDLRRSFPAQANYDDQGQPLLSWRVHVLPFFDSKARRLYRDFKLDEPWDSDHNRPLVNKMPEVYAMLGSKATHEGRTRYVRPVGETTTCPGSQAITCADIADGTGNTVLVVEVDDEHAVIWTKPDDLDFDLDNPGKGLGGNIPGTAWAVFCDAHPHVLRNLLTDPDRVNQLKGIFTRNGGENVHPID